MRSKIFRFHSMRLLTVLFFLIALFAKADHYYGGYITYKHLGGYTYKVSVVTYADNDLVNSDRDSIEVIWGDGAEEYLQRVNNVGNGETVFPGVKKNIYEGEHTYTEEGNYQLVFVDQFRPFDIKNISIGESGFTALYFDAIVPVADTTSFCKNNAPSFKTEPFFFGRPGEDFRLSLTHYDLDGDSLSFKLSVPKARNAENVPSYFVPTGVSLNPKTGMFSWDNPTFGGWVFAYEIEEFRDGQLIGTSIADFPVYIKEDIEYKGVFTPVEGVLEDHYHFTAPEEIDLIVTYENDSADTVIIEAFHALNHHFNVSQSSSSIGGIANDTLTIDYLGNDNNQGNYIITFQAASIYGLDTIFDYYSVSLSTESDTSWSCSVPPNIREVVEIAPSVNQFEISPNLFTESVWVNVGENFENMKVDVYDMRGRLVAKEHNPTTGTFKMDLITLGTGMYFFRIEREGESIAVLKSVKR